MSMEEEVFVSQVMASSYFFLRCLSMCDSSSLVGCRYCLMCECDLCDVTCSDQSVNDWAIQGKQRKLFRQC